MGQLIDLTGRTFVRWKVRGLSHKEGKTYYWNCVCDCGTERKVPGRDLTRKVKSSKSCGCLQSEENSERMKIHGMSGHPAYCSWQQARDRCRNPNNEEAWPMYGGRGIKFSEAWNDFSAFWAEMGATWKKGLTLDRIDVNGNYEPGNCRWATAEEQASNRRDNRMVTASNGEKTTLKRAAKIAGIPYATVQARVRYGWDEKDLFLPSTRTGAQARLAHIDKLKSQGGKCACCGVDSKEHKRVLGQHKKFSEDKFGNLVCSKCIELLQWSDYDAKLIERLKMFIQGQTD